MESETKFFNSDWEKACHLAIASFDLAAPLAMLGIEFVRAITTDSVGPNSLLLLTLAGGVVGWGGALYELGEFFERKDNEENFDSFLDD